MKNLYTKKLKNWLYIYLSTLIACFCFSCARHHPHTQHPSTLRAENRGQLTCIHIIDKNGFTETISDKDRLKRYEHTDFLSQQPYQKVLRVFQKSADGHIDSVITTYHTNGELKQFLEIRDGRAHGNFVEWHPNKKKKLQTIVADGNADIDEMSQLTWSLDGESKAWDDDGHVIAEIPYEKGALSGQALYYYSDGSIEKNISYQKGKISGLVREWYPNKTLRLEESYHNGEKQGLTKGFWSNGQLAFEETYEANLLMNAVYIDQDQQIISSITKGNGIKSFFDEKGVRQLAEYKNGEQEGVVTLLEDSYITCIYTTKNGKKQGTETFYFQPQNTPKLCIEWDNGIINGIVKTWYDCGQQESQREMSQNKKHGVYTAWYRDGSLMCVEEYDKNRLIKGYYFRKGEKNPISKIDQGSGVVTFFDSNGNFIKKISYHNGSPSCSDEP